MTQKLPNRIPFEEVSQFKNWVIPTVGGKVVPSVQRQEQKKPLPKQANETVEELAPEAISVKPMTAQQLQEIADQASREGFDQGYEEGLKKGLQEGERQGLEQGKVAAYSEHSHSLQEQAQGLAAICQDLMEPMASQNRDLENQVVNLAVNLAKHLLHQELQQRPEAIFPVVEAAVNSLPAGARNLKLYLHPDDLGFVQVHAQAMGRDWQCMADVRLSRGSCRLETAQTLVNYSIEERLQQWLEHAKLRQVSHESPIVEDYRLETHLVETEAQAEAAEDSASEIEPAPAAATNVLTGVDTPAANPD